MKDKYPWWPILLAIPIFGWLVAAILLIHDAMQTLPYRLRHGHWKDPSGGRITWTDRDGNPCAAEDAVWVVKDGVKEAWNWPKPTKPIWLPLGDNEAAITAWLRTNMPYISPEERAWRKERDIAEDPYQQGRADAEILAKGKIA